VEQIRTIDRSRLGAYIGRVEDNVMPLIDKALAVCMGIEQRRSKKGEMMELNLCLRCERNFRDSGYAVIKKGWREVKETCDFCQSAKGLPFGVFNTDLTA
jgi:mRNA interferase MazF